jgi:hypothetical protein
MNPKHGRKWAVFFVSSTIAVAPPSGCYPFSTVNVLWGGDPVKPAECPLVFKDGPKKGKEVVVALFISSAAGMGPEFARSEDILASDIAAIFPALATKSKQKLAVIDPVLVNKFVMKTPNMNRIHPGEWAWNLGADYVLMVHLDKMSLYQPGSRNQLYEGAADVTVDVFDVDAGPTQPVYHYIIPFKYPRHVLDPSTIPVNKFKKDFLEHLAIEICNRHVEHKVSSVIAEEE